MAHPLDNLAMEPPQKKYRPEQVASLVERGQITSLDELGVLTKQLDQNQRRYEAAAQLMPGILATMAKKTLDHDLLVEAAKRAVEGADALLKALEPKGV